MNNLERISHEIMVFMRGKYRLDEIGDGKDELKFKQGAKTILTIYLHEDKYTFLVIFGKKIYYAVKFIVGFCFVFINQSCKHMRQRRNQNV